MTERFQLEHVGGEDSTDENKISGFGLLDLFNCRVEYHFRTDDMSLEEAEVYIRDVLNQLPNESVDEICEKACNWKADKMSSDTANYPDGLAEAYDREILAYMSVGDVALYRNPYDRNDTAFGAILGGGAEWDSENGMEIVIRGNKVLEVREFLGYGEYAIWNETD
ncbi:DUF6985 domain-containing protein [Paenibacillus sp. MMS18-CY102]|uniref:DUF6985 domain-containing protein n=1 Tax=Paenibacillus sp. MMS18-CY102 TaxID=2682849 RepID=UPI0013655A7E|nr:hypothetical protein [Paenibacillus sp. MMS18-CY102]MWC27650.1 hypothetical protein [Paenibacillus sp. MMS18-CY102]